MRWLLTLALAGCGPPQEPAYVIDLDPPEDRTLAPYTGWTRAHYEALFGRMLLGYTRHLSEDGAIVLLPSEDGLSGGFSPIEGVTRMMTAIGAWLSDPDTPSVLEVDGQRIDLVTITRRTLGALADPKNPMPWPYPERNSQMMVEAAYLAEFLVMTRDRVWDGLAEDDKAEVMSVLAPADPEREIYTNNWSLFPTMRNVARARLGWDQSPDDTDEFLDRIEAR